MEVAQATYLRIFKHIHSLPDEAALWSWIACAARSAAIDLRRVNGRYHSALRRFGDWIIRYGRCRSPESTSEASLLDALEHGLFALSDDDRGLLQARYFRGVSLHELAQANQLSARALEARLARARQRLRERIAAALLKDEA
jgi:RNA polymerase sigma factor (sigma-70 family)